MAFPSGWQWRCPVVIDPFAVGSGGVADFSALLRIESAKLTAARVDRGDVRWTLDQAGEIPLPADFLYDWFGEAWWRVRVPSILSSATTTVWAWWGNASASMPAPDDPIGRENVYDSDWAWYAPDLSMDRIGGDAPSATGDVASDRTWGGSGIQFAGGRITLPSADIGDYTASAMTFSCVIRLDDLNVNQYKRIYQTYGSGGSPQTDLSFRNTSSPANRIEYGRDGASAVTARPLSGAERLALTSGTNGAGTIRIGNNSYSIPSFSKATSASPLTLGNNAEGNRPAPCTMGHVSFHRVQRSTAWLDTEANQTMSPAGFSSVGEPERVRRFRPWFASRPILIGAGV